VRTVPERTPAQTPDLGPPAQELRRQTPLQASLQKTLCTHDSSDLRGKKVEYLFFKWVGPTEWTKPPPSPSNKELENLHYHPKHNSTASPTLSTKPGQLLNSHPKPPPPKDPAPPHRSPAPHPPTNPKPIPQTKNTPPPNPTPNNRQPTPIPPRNSPLTNAKHNRKLSTPLILLLSTLGLLALFILITLIAFITNNKSNDNTTTIDLRHTLEHDNYVHNVDFSPNAGLVVTTSKDGTAKIWDAKTGEPLHALQQDRGVESADFSPNSNHVITTSKDGTAIIWDTRTGQLLFSLQHDDWVRHAVFSPNSNHVITASRDGTAKIWKIS